MKGCAGGEDVSGGAQVEGLGVGGGVTGNQGFAEVEIDGESKHETFERQVSELVDVWVTLMLELLELSIPVQVLGPDGRVLLRETV